MQTKAGWYIDKHQRIPVMTEYFEEVRNERCAPNDTEDRIYKYRKDRRFTEDASFYESKEEATSKWNERIKTQIKILEEKIELLKSDLIR